jgi:hypothetical protein
MNTATRVGIFFIALFALFWLFRIGSDFISVSRAKTQIAYLDSYCQTNGRYPTDDQFFEHVYGRPASFIEQVYGQYNYVDTYQMDEKNGGITSTSTKKDSYVLTYKTQGTEFFAIGSENLDASTFGLRHAGYYYASTCSPHR